MELSFEIESGVQVYASCGVQFKGNFYVYGSHSYFGNQQQIAQVSNCSLKHIATLEFDHFEGSCAATSTQLFLCFDNDEDGKTCRTSNKPTGPFSLRTKSIETHKNIRIAASEEYILACGNGNGGEDVNDMHNKCEIHKVNDNKWESIAAYPFVKG